MPLFLSLLSFRSFLCLLSFYFSPPTSSSFFLFTSASYIYIYICICICIFFFLSSRCLLLDYPRILMDHLENLFFICTFTNRPEIFFETKYLVRKNNVRNRFLSLPINRCIYCTHCSVIITFTSETIRWKKIFFADIFFLFYYFT